MAPVGVTEAGCPTWPFPAEDPTASLLYAITEPLLNVALFRVPESVRLAAASVSAAAACSVPHAASNRAAPTTGGSGTSAAHAASSQAAAGAGPLGDPAQDPAPSAPSGSESSPEFPCRAPPISFSDSAVGVPHRGMLTSSSFSDILSDGSSPGCGLEVNAAAPACQLLGSPNALPTPPGSPDRRHGPLQRQLGGVASARRVGPGAVGGAQQPASGGGVGTTGGGQARRPVAPAGAPSGLEPAAAPARPPPPEEAEAEAPAADSESSEAMRIVNQQWALALPPAPPPTGATAAPGPPLGAAPGGMQED